MIGGEAIYYKRIWGFSEKKNLEDRFSFLFFIFLISYIAYNKK